MTDGAVIGWLNDSSTDADTIQNIDDLMGELVHMSVECTLNATDPGREVFCTTNGDPMERAIEIGMALNNLGGKRAMVGGLQAVENYGIADDAVELNYAWDGIGDWIEKHVS